ncbi:tumor necrosis factor receptor superfamily, member 12a, isoform CRA_b [Rattus norvegicus]|uniref:Tumor necrosis factor receptor superfamily member 12A n=1 Tax=Rattus norvegicus TaxID=10116 RepID=A6HCL0_RAT|nr:tumor necrosis factor receptor superfamily, member 12a, isoform CRA_b [Rattus norvegicus]
MAPGWPRPLPQLLVLGFGLVLIHATAGEQAPGNAPCSSGSSWSADLDKCMDCASCPARPHSDFCLGFSWSGDDAAGEKSLLPP